MQITSNLRSNSQSFGMAFIPKYADETMSSLLKGTAEIRDYLGLMRSHGNVSGYKQLKKHLKNSQYYDLVFDVQTKTAHVVEKSTQKVVESYAESPQGITGLEHFGVVKYPGRVLLAELFKPRKFLPYNVNLAYDKIQKLEKVAAKKAKIDAMM